MTLGNQLPSSKISSGVESLDILISGFSIGDNVVWEVEAGTAYGIFIRNFLRRSFAEAQKVIYVSCNRSPQTILNDFGSLLDEEHFTLVDGFTSGKGKNDNTFLKFYDKPTATNVVRIENPKDIERFTATLNAIEDRLPPGARYVFDSLTGMQDLWGDENETHRFFTYMCPRLYDLGTVAYWLLEKDAHSPKFKANLRHITQVVLDLYKRKNALYIKALKLEGRQNREAFKPHAYEIRDEVVTIAPQKKETSSDIGVRLKDERMRLGMSQKEVADRVNVTPSFLSQLESNQVSPSLPTFLQICRALGINPGQFLDLGGEKHDTPWLLRKEQIFSRPAGRDDGAKIYEVAGGGKHSARIVVLAPSSVLNRHFNYLKEEELIYVLKGDLTVTMGGREERIRVGDIIRLKESFPSQWKNEGGDEAELLVLW
ncbi:MAG: helix-turn-helix domain-containing protein [Nitrospirota bacterium]|nr:helix-turn-helix domain-containing protein [Nitrospirota bacterium]